ncbi:MAG: ROK family protein [Bacteroidales bacterium]|nr:ROK family protein [Bacteroidales bacterium]
MSYIGIDIGGTKISGIRLEGEKIVDRAKADTGASRPVQEIMGTLFDVIRGVLIDDVKAIGIGVPGILDVEEGKIININNIPEFNGVNLKKPIEKAFGIPAFINNDANCFALSEAYFGAGKPYSNIIGITLGTGVGGGIVINRQIYSGNLGAAGEFGCVPYRDGLFEEYGGSKFFEKFYDATGKELYDRAEKNDRVAKEAFLEYGQHIASIITYMMLTIAPEAIIIGGSITNAYKYFEPSIREMLDNFSIPVIAKHVKILPATLSDSGVLGAAALGMSEHGQQKV